MDDRAVRQVEVKTIQSLRFTFASGVTCRSATTSGTPSFGADY